MTSTQWLPLALGLFLILNAGGANASAWTKERANACYDRQPWLVGCNFTPSTAINQLETWQADTFDPATIDRELGRAEKIGFNSVRVFLHSIPWDQDSKGSLGRIEKFLPIAEKRHIRTMFVLMDGCWNSFPKPGEQPKPKPHVHNSGWVQCPGFEILNDPARHGELEGYVKGVIGRFAKDKRVLAWDLFNEPDFDNRGFGVKEPENKPEVALALLKKAFAWALEVNPSQPLTTPFWWGDGTSPLRLNLRRLPATADILRTMADEIVVSQRFADVIVDNDVTGVELAPIEHTNRTLADTVELGMVPSGRTLLGQAELAGCPHPTWAFCVWLNHSEQEAGYQRARDEFTRLKHHEAGKPRVALRTWHELVCQMPRVSVAPPKLSGSDPSDPDVEGKNRCPLGHVHGLNPLSEVTVDAATWGGNDLTATRQLFGTRRGSLRHFPVILATPRFRDLAITNALNGARFEIARFS